MPRLRGSANRQATTSIFEDRIARKPPQCRVFSCTRDYRATRCCYFCRRKYACLSPCLNHPIDCGLVVIPKRKEDKNNDEPDT